MSDRALAWTVLGSVGLHVAALGALSLLGPAHASAPPAPVAIELVAVSPPPAPEPVVRRAPAPPPQRVTPPKPRPVETVAETRPAAPDPPAPAPIEESPPPTAPAPSAPPDLVPDAAPSRALASSREPRGAARPMPAFASVAPDARSAFVPGATGRTERGDGLFQFPVSAPASGTPGGSGAGPAGRADGGTGNGPLTAFVRPLGGYQTKPRYPDWARRQGIEGVTHLRFEVLTTGTVGKVLVERSAGNAELDQAAVESVKSWRFEPARRGAEAVKVWVTMPVRFSLVTP